ncbi:hypothetical protein [Paenibacillus sp. OAS669]|uniref:hypothetical protein n=1 Tax=Paenibacillus sp. OAS669 TaxID=2663821 RepID=UPI00178B19CB|nr:hypothetical protein [Paenibacillus sp. OAS669]MBE1446163.1 hypothetical protein [Paenibacillus sp. OAS669]
MNVIRVYNPNATASFMSLFMPIVEDQIGKIVDKITRQENENVPTLPSHNQEN